MFKTVSTSSCAYLGPIIEYFISNSFYSHANQEIRNKNMLSGD